jgi:hypothetical protein
LRQRHSRYAVGHVLNRNRPGIDSRTWEDPQKTSILSGKMTGLTGHLFLETWRSDPLLARGWERTEQARAETVGEADSLPFAAK